MKRGGFAPKYPRREATQCSYTPRPREVAVASGEARMSVPVPKQAYVRSKALLEACREIPCQHCHRDDGTVVAAHSNQARHGKASTARVGRARRGR